MSTAMSSSLGCSSGSIEGRKLLSEKVCSKRKNFLPTLRKHFGLFFTSLDSISLLYKNYSLSTFVILGLWTVVILFGIYVVEFDFKKFNRNYGLIHSSGHLGHFISKELAILFETFIFILQFSELHRFDASGSECYEA